MNIPHLKRVPFLALIATLLLSTAVSAAGVAEKQLDPTYTAEVFKRNGSVAATGNFAMGSNRITGMADGIAATDAATVQQVTAASAGLDVKDSVRTHNDIEDGILDGNATITASSTAYDSDAGTSSRGQITATLGVSETFTVDGVAMADGDRMLISSEGGGTAEVMGVDTVADSAGSLNNDYWVFYTNASTAFYVWYNVNAAGSDPAPSPPAGVSYTGIEVALATNDTANTVASATETAIEASAAEVGDVIVSTNEMTITNSFGGNVTDVAEGVGTGFTFATDTQGTGLGADANGIYVVTITGTALVLDRSTDFDEDAEVTQGAYTLVAEGTDHGGHGHVLSTSDPITIGGAGGTSQTWAEFSKLDLAGVGEITTVNGGDVAAAGTSGNAARGDHEHAVATGTPGGVTLDAAAAEGTSTDLARADHEHGLAAAIAGAIQPDDAAAEGSSGSVARADHTHSIVSGSPSASVDAGDAADEGTSTGFARDDHQHAVSTATAVAATAGQASGEGAGTGLARATHTHAHSTAAAVDVGTANAAGSASTFASSDHVHDAPTITDANKKAASAVTTGTNETTGLTIASTPALGSQPWIDVNGVVYGVGDGTDVADFYYSGDACTTPRATAAIVATDVLCQGDNLPFNLAASDLIGQHYPTFTNN